MGILRSLWVSHSVGHVAWMTISLRRDPRVHYEQLQIRPIGDPRVRPAALPETRAQGAAIRPRLPSSAVHGCRMRRYAALQKPPFYAAVSRLHSSPARDGVTVQGCAGVYCPGGAKDASGGARKCRAGCQKSSAAAGNTEPGGWPPRCVIALWRAVGRSSGGRLSAVRGMPRERAAIPMGVLGRATVGPLPLRSRASPTGVLLSRRLRLGLARDSRRAFCLAVPSSSPVFPPGGGELPPRSGHEASVEAQRGVSEMTGTSHRRRGCGRG
jgi:hypothetical protein